MKLSKILGSFLILKGVAGGLIPMDFGYSVIPRIFNPTNIQHCPIDIPLSCSNSTVVDNSCCFEYPGGVLLQTQFWDYYPPIGPVDMFTLHGLWPDRCDGDFDQFCDASMEIESVRTILKDFKEFELLEKMEKVWKNYNGDDDALWVHEFNKHGTCLSTLKTSCYDQKNYVKYQNIVDFFKKTVKLFENLPTHDWLIANGIVPSVEQTYSKSQIESTLSARFGQPVFIKCNRFNALQEVWYFHHLQGSITQGNYVPIPALLNSRCPENGIKWIPKKGFKPPSPTDPHQPPRPTGALSGYLKPENHQGCLISNGHWYTSGTCATFQLIKAPFGGYNVKSSRGFCQVAADQTFVCGHSVKPMQFNFNAESRYLYFGGKSKWTAERSPSKFQQVPIRPGDEDAISFKLKLD